MVCPEVTVRVTKIGPHYPTYRIAKAFSVKNNGNSTFMLENGEPDRKTKSWDQCIELIMCKAHRYKSVRTQLLGYEKCQFRCTDPIQYSSAEAFKLKIHSTSMQFQ